MKTAVEGNKLRTPSFVCTLFRGCKVWGMHYWFSTFLFSLIMNTYTQNKLIQYHPWSFYYNFLYSHSHSEKRYDNRTGIYQNISNLYHQESWLHKRVFFNSIFLSLFLLLITYNSFLFFFLFSSLVVLFFFFFFFFFADQRWYETR